MSTGQNAAFQIPPIQPFAKFRKEAGIGETTGWKMRRAGWIKTVTIAGRPYVTAEEIARFKERAANGDFAGLQPKPLSKSEKEVL